MDRFTTKGSPKAELLGCVYCLEHSNCYSNMSCDEVYNALSKLRYYENLEEQGRLVILLEKAEADSNRCCKTCYADDMDYKQVDIPCWNCKGDHSEWKPKEN